MTRTRRLVPPAADVVLVSMPFGELLSPSMGLSLLKAALNREGVSSLVRYFGIQFARRIGRSLYDILASDKRLSALYLAGEWMFASAVFASGPQDDNRYIADILRRQSGWITGDVPPVHPGTIRRLLAARQHVESFLDDCVEQVLSVRPRLVGFTSVFQQHVASLALAKRLKQQAPDLVVMFGGSNCEGVMGAETVRQFLFIDAAVSGEADLVFPEIVRRVLHGRSLTGIAGIHTRESVDRDFLSEAFENAASVRDMDSLPWPDYDDFFAEFEATGFKSAWQPRLLIETSRGCWWGEKKHCTFCGLNGQTMTFRSKGAARVLAELSLLASRYPECDDVQVVDNILDMRYFSDLLPALAERQLGIQLFYETKANLKKEQIRLLRAAGVTEIQPGIESFSDRVLELMRKGITALQNIQLLKWCTELGVRPYWNLLWGFPGEPPDDYRRMTELVPLLTHLGPPVGFGGLRLDRFSPNFFDADRLGFRNVRPLPAYEYVYPLPAAVLANLAYNFTFDYADGRRVDEYISPLLRQLRWWRALEGESTLFSADLGDALVIFDTRPAAKCPVTVLSGLDRQLYLQCDAIADVRRLSVLAQANGDQSAVRRLEPLCASGLLLRDDGRYLALAIPLGDFQPSPLATKRLRASLAGLGYPRAQDLLIPLATMADSSIQYIDRGRRVQSSPARVPRFTRFAPAQLELRGTHELLIRSPRSSRQFIERSV